MDATVGNKKGNTVIQVIAASMIAVIVSLVLILLSAAIINALDVDSDIWLTVINQIIKGVSLLAGCLIMFKNVRNGWLKGLVTGIVYIVLSFVVFSLMYMQFSIDLSFLVDLLTGAAMGLICGVIAVNVRKKR